MKKESPVLQFAGILQRSVAAIVLILLAISLGSCGGTTAPPAPAVATLALTPANSTILLGNTQQLTATFTGADGVSSNMTSSPRGVLRLRQWPRSAARAW